MTAASEQGRWSVGEDSEREFYGSLFTRFKLDSDRGAAMRSGEERGGSLDDYAHEREMGRTTSRSDSPLLGWTADNGELLVTVTSFHRHTHNIPRIASNNTNSPFLVALVVLR